MSSMRIKGRAHRSDERLASAARTATAASVSMQLGAYNELCVIVRVTAASGTSPTLDVTLQVSADGTNWVDHTSLTQLTAAGSTAKIVTGFGNYTRINAVIAGTTPSFTFTVHTVAKA